MLEIYRGVNGVNKLITQQFRGVSGVNRDIKEQYRGVNGVNRLVFKRGYNIEDISKMTFEYTISPYPDDGYMQTEKEYIVTVLHDTEYHTIHGRCPNAHRGVQLNGNYYIIFNDGIRIPFMKDNLKNAFYNTYNISLKFLCYGIASLKRKDETKTHSGQAIIKMFGNNYTNNIISSEEYGCNEVKTFQTIEDYPLNNNIELKARSKIVIEDWTANTISEIELKVPIFEFKNDINTRKFLPELLNG